MEARVESSRFNERVVHPMCLLTASPHVCHALTKIPKPPALGDRPAPMSWLLWYTAARAPARSGAHATMHNNTERKEK